jgi:y4mF family transcriptional regulator
MTFGQRIKQYRKQSGMTQEDLAEAIGVTQESISQMENDKVRIYLDKLNDICKALNITLEQILEE